MNYSLGSKENFHFRLKKKSLPCIRIIFGSTKLILFDLYQQVKWIQVSPLNNNGSQKKRYKVHKAVIFNKKN